MLYFKPLPLPIRIIIIIQIALRKSLVQDIAQACNAAQRKIRKTSRRNRRKPEGIARYIDNTFLSLKSLALTLSLCIFLNKQIQVQVRLFNKGYPLLTSQPSRYFVPLQSVNQHREYYTYYKKGISTHKVKTYINIATRCPFLSYSSVPHRYSYNMT